jgi:RNA-binding protein YhbY
MTKATKEIRDAIEQLLRSASGDLSRTEFLHLLDMIGRRLIWYRERMETNGKNFLLDFRS